MHRTFKKPVIAFFFLLSLCVILYAAYQEGIWRFNRPDIRDYPQQGLDVSEVQGAIRWADVPKDQFKFVYIRASEGSGGRDKNFDVNWKNARAAGLQTGAYHVFNLCEAGDLQLKNFMAVLPVDDNTLPPGVALDLNGACTDLPSQEKLSGELQDFLLQFKMHYHVRPVLYTSRQFYKRYLTNKVVAFDTYPLWIRSVFRSPHGDLATKWAIWQYADQARIPGIDGPVHLDVLRPHS